MRSVLLLGTFIATLIASLGGSDARSMPVPLTGAQPSVSSSEPVFIVYYWRARPGKTAAYSDYIRTVAEPIDEEAQKAGVFEEVHTYTPALVTGAPGSDWTHMRVFRLKNIAAWETFGTGLDEAAKRVYPGEAKRREMMNPATELRDLVRQEMWRAFR